MSGKAQELQRQILDLVDQYYQEAFPSRPFVPGSTPVPVCGRVFDGGELQFLVDAALEFWLTSGRFAAEFEKALARHFGIRSASLTNSGSSANLLALSCLTSTMLGDRRLRPGDEVITTAAGFPTTVNPIVQNGLIPVFVDIDVPTYNVNVNQLEQAVSKKTRAVILAHTLGNSFNVSAVKDLTERHGLWLNEDCCDAVGSTYNGQHVGTFGELATTSFYAAHHITTGEGGCVLTNQPLLKTLVESFRDWGRDCWCDTGKANTCGKRFEWQLGDLPCGYDHKYIYSHVGYNLKMTDMQAAIGVMQMRKLPQFIEARKRNFRELREGLRSLEEFFIFGEPTPGSDPSWFGFPIAVRPGAPFSRTDVVQYLESKKIATRHLFGGNLVRQPAYHDVPHRVAGSLHNTDFAMDHLFWIGVYPGISRQMLEYMLEMLHVMPKTLLCVTT